MIYLDWNATTPPAAEVVEAMERALADGWANPASVHAAGRRARAFVEDAREAVAELCGFDPRDVVLTGGGTEANALALRSVFAGGAGGALVASPIEHPSVVRTAEGLGGLGIEVVWVAPEPDGRVDPERVARAVSDLGGRCRLVSLQAVNHETGVVQPVEAVRAVAAAHGALLHCDAVQAVGRLLPSSWAGADIVTVAAHKIRGPKGAGAVMTRPGIELAPVILGGAQEKGVRPGTQDPVTLAGFAAAARRARTGHARYAALQALRDRLERTLLALDAAPQQNGTAPRAPHVSNLSFGGWHGPELCAALDLEGVCVSSGSACSAGTAEPSPVITAMLGAGRARSAVRISLGEDSSPSDIDAATLAFKRVLGRV